MKLILLYGLFLGSIANADQIKDYRYFCENPSESASATHTVELIRDRMVYDHDWDMSGSCEAQFSKIQTVNTIWINGFNELVDVRPFANLPLLKSLAFPKNKVRDLSPLALSPNLEFLTLWANEISDLSPLVSLKHLHIVLLSDNRITDASPLARIPTLTMVSLAENKLQSADFVRSLPNLVGLYLSQTDLKTLPDLSDLTKLEALDVSFNQLSLVLGLGRLTSLREVDISANKQIRTVESLRDLLGLRQFFAFDCSFTAIPELPTQLDSSSSWGFDLNLAENEVSDISALRNISYPIYKLVLKRNKIVDLGVIASTRGIATLDVSSNRVADITPLNGVWISELIASHNQIASLESFKPNGLTSLYLDDNHIPSIAPLAATLPKLFHFSIGKNPIQDVEQINLLTASNLPTIDISGIGLKDLSFMDPRLLQLVHGIDVSNNDLTDLSPLLVSNNADFIHIGCNPKVPQEQIAALIKRHNIGGREIVSTRCR